jgi:hypothetical protein
MSEFTHRPLSETEQWASEYESLVAELPDGYSMSIYEYTNDFACRNRLEAAKDSPEVAAIWPRVESADATLKRLLLPTTRCIRGDHPRSSFWYWGYPPDSPSLEADLKAQGVI